MNNKHKANTTRTLLLILISNESKNVTKQPNSDSTLFSFKINHQTPYEMIQRYEEFEIQITNPLITGINCRKCVTKSYNKMHNNSNTPKSNNHSISEQIEVFPGIEINQYISSLHSRKLICSSKKLKYFDEGSNNNNIDNSNDDTNATSDDSNSLIKINQYCQKDNSKTKMKTSMIMLYKIAYSLKNLSCNNRKCKHNNNNHKNDNEHNECNYIKKSRTSYENIKSNNKNINSNNEINNNILQTPFHIIKGTKKQTFTFTPKNHVLSCRVDRSYNKTISGSNRKVKSYFINSSINSLNNTNTSDTALGYISLTSRKCKQESNCIFYEENNIQYNKWNKDCQRYSKYTGLYNQFICNGDNSNRYHLFI